MDRRDLTPERMSHVAAYLEKMEAEVPAELLAEARSMSTKDLLEGTLHRAIDDVQTLMRLYSQAASRCAVCRANERQCGHCFAEMQVFEQLLQGVVSVALLAKIATAPGTRIAAEREREDEERRNTEKPTTA